MKRIKLLPEDISTVAIYNPHVVGALEALINNDIKSNILCIYGHCGTGKSYLLELTKSALVDFGYSIDDIININAYDWIENLTVALKNNRIDEFKKQYDVKKYVFIEDIQHYFYKDRSQEEFLLFVKRAERLNIKIIITSSCYPLENNSNAGINEHLMFRLCSGVLVRLIEPNGNAKKHFISSYSNRICLSLNAKTIDLINSKVSANYFEIVGFLNSLKLYKSNTSKKTLSEYITSIYP